MGSGIVINCSGLTKDYGSNNGLFNLDLTINQGEIFGLIGPNGAGKSTFIKLAMDLIRPTSGSVAIFGLDAERDSVTIKKDVGYLPGELMQFPNVTAHYILKLLMNLRKNNDFSYIVELAERLQLDLDRKFQELSHGNKQKVAVIQALMHRPKLLILDEPTLGLDPFIQREFRNLIAEFSQIGNTVILSSHVLTEVENICTRVGVINNGRLIKEGALKDIRASNKRTLTAHFVGEIPDTSTISIPGVTKIERIGDALTFDVAGSVQELLVYLSTFDIADLTSSELSLEEVFFSEINN